MFIGGIRAILLQTLHPAAMTAVAEHSGYRGDMWGRLARTSRFIAVTTFGTADDAQRAVDAVRGIHDRITGTMPDGTSYAASDPHLLMWVHVAEIESFLLAHQTYGKRPLDQAGRDEYVAQTAEVARRLGVVDPPTHRGGARDDPGGVPARAARHRPRPRRGRVPALAARAAAPAAAGVRRADGGRDRADAALDPSAAAAAVDAHDRPHRRPSAGWTPPPRTIRWAMAPGRAAVADARSSQQPTPPESAVAGKSR